MNLLGRLYTQINISASGGVAKSRQDNSKDFQEVGGRVDAATVTPDEVLEQANRIFAPYKLTFASPLSWFAVWKSEFTYHGFMRYRSIVDICSSHLIFVFILENTQMSPIMS